MSVYIKDMEMPKNCYVCPFCDYVSARCDAVKGTPYTPQNRYEARAEWCPLVPVPEHGRLIDADALRQSMYHEAFETDSPMQKWDSGCWIRYKMFERLEESAPTIIPADKEGEG